MVCALFHKSMACFHYNLSSSLVLKLIYRISLAGRPAIISVSDLTQSLYKTVNS